MNWQLSKQGIRWPISPDCIAGSGVDPSRSSIFWSYPLISSFFSNNRRFKFLFLIHMKYVVFMCRTIKILNWIQTDLGCEHSGSYYRQGRQLLLTSRHGHALVTLYVQFLCSDWSKFDRWVHAENLSSILKLVYLDSWSWQSFVSSCDAFNCLFPLDVQNEIQLLSRVFHYSWLVCLLSFWLGNTSLVKVGNPILNAIVFVFHLAQCVRGLKSMKRFCPYLIAFKSCIRTESLRNYCI